MSTLSALHQHGESNHRAVADRCFVRPATLTGVVDTPERDGLVERHRDGTDRRAVRRPPRHCPVARRARSARSGLIPSPVTAGRRSSPGIPTSPDSGREQVVGADGDHVADQA